MAEITDEQKAFVENIEEWIRGTLGGTGGALYHQNDWTLVIKLHALIESALNAVLVAQFRAPELSRIIAKLDTGNTASGKVAFAKALGIISHESHVFVQKLSELRNFCVHDIRNFNFDLVEYLQSPEDADRKKALLKAVAREIRPGAHVESPQESLKIATMNVIMQLRVHHLRCETEDLEAENRRLGAERYDALNQSTPKES